MSGSYESNVHEQMMDLEGGCLEMRALPLVLICIDGKKRGHMFYPDDLPPEMVAALPALLDDVRESLEREPLS